jgi:hypothetical protein
MSYMYESQVDELRKWFMFPLANRSCHISVMQVLERTFRMDGANIQRILATMGWKYIVQVPPALRYFLYVPPRYYYVRELSTRLPRCCWLLLIVMPSLRNAFRLVDLEVIRDLVGQLIRATEATQKLSFQCRSPVYNQHQYPRFSPRKTVRRVGRGLKKHSSGYGLS